MDNSLKRALLRILAASFVAALINTSVWIDPVVPLGVRIALLIGALISGTFAYGVAGKHKVYLPHRTLHLMAFMVAALGLVGPYILLAIRNVRGGDYNAALVACAVLYLIGAGWIVLLKLVEPGRNQTKVSAD